MNLSSTTTGTASELQPWIDLVESMSHGALNVTIGLISGCREGNERGALDRLASASLTGDAARQLLVRLGLDNEGLSKRQLRTARASEQAPTPVVSPLGKWNEVCVPIHLGSTAPVALERLPRWLSAWKRDYSRVLLDLGPLDQPICRAMGRLCDCCMLLLGPETCASPTWLRTHIDHLTQCHARLTGSIVIKTRHQSVA